MHEHHDPAESNALEYGKFVLVLAAISTVSYLLFSTNDTYVFADWLRIFMGTFLVTFSAFKLMGYKMFVEMYPMYDLVAKRSQLYAKAFPFIELALGLSFLANIAEVPRLVFTAIIMGIGALGIIQTVYVQRKKIHCACLGNIIKLPLSTVSLFEDLLMVAMAIWMLTL